MLDAEVITAFGATYSCLGKDFYSHVVLLSMFKRLKGNISMYV
jgi:hypothetical protein